MRQKGQWVGWFILTTLVFLALSVQSLTGYTFDGQDAESILLSPSWRHLFGTDSLGRDVFTRAFYGARVSLFVALFSGCLAMVVGVTIGALAGWFQGSVDRFIIRTIDIGQAIPSFLLASVLCLFLQKYLDAGGFGLSTMVAIGLSISAVQWFNIAKVTRGQTRQIKSLDYIQAAEAIGAKPVRIFVNHVLPNMQRPLLTLFTLQVPASILYESMLSFSGYGLQSPQVSWGILLHEGWRSLSEFPHLLLLPALVLFLTVMGFHLILSRR